MHALTQAHKDLLLTRHKVQTQSIIPHCYSIGISSDLNTAWLRNASQLTKRTSRDQPQMFTTHPQLEGPRWTWSCFDCPQHFYWSMSGNMRTTGTTHWWHSLLHKELHKPQLQDGEGLSRGDVVLLHLEQTKEDRCGRRLSLVQNPWSASNRLTLCQ